MEPLYESETGCCPRFDPGPWDQKEVSWEDKLFIKDRIRCLFHIPLNFGRVMVRNMEKIQKAQAQPPAPLMLCDESSPWRSEVYIAVDKEVPDAERATISGTFMTKVYEGHYKNVPNWMKDMKDHVRQSGKEAKKFYTFYTTCPKCARHYGKNYVVLLAQFQ